MTDYKKGLLCGAGAYVIWGILPVYWKLLDEVSPFEILAGRILWSLVFVVLLLLVQNKTAVFISEVKMVFSSFKTGAAMVAAAVVISVNWGTFIWGVNNGHILETSIGYYINPLMSVLFAVVFLHEALSKLQLAAVLCASVGVGSMVWSFGSLPWLSLLLAVTFASYSLIKKLLPVSSLTSITLETLLASPAALAYEYLLLIQDASFYTSCNWPVLCLLAGAGVVTAVPMLIFTQGAKLLPLKITGFLQYIYPTLALFLGVFVYGEPFTGGHLLAFGWIWAALALFIVSQLRKS